MGLLSIFEGGTDREAVDFGELWFPLVRLTISDIRDSNSLR